MPSSKPNTGPSRVICLIGFMGAGKTTVGQALAARLRCKFADLDSVIEEFERASVAEIFSRSGQAAFRQSETAALNHVLGSSRSEPLILAIGGGGYQKPENQAALKKANAYVIFLSASADELWQRVNQQDTASRPMVSDKNSFFTLYANRLPHFSQAQATLETDGKSVEQVAAEIHKLLQGSQEALEAE